MKALAGISADVAVLGAEALSTPLSATLARVGVETLLAAVAKLACVGAIALSLAGRLAEVAPTGVEALSLGGNAAEVG